LSNQTTSEYLVLYANNDFGSQNVQFNLQMSPAQPSNNNSSGGSYLWIVFLVVGLVIMIVTMVVAVKKCRPKEQTEGRETLISNKTNPDIVNQAWEKFNMGLKIKIFVIDCYFMNLFFIKIWLPCLLWN